MIQDDWDRARSRNGVTGVNNAEARQRYDFRNDAELNVFIDGRTSNGMTYGAVFEMQMDNVVATAGDGTTVSFDELYGYIGVDGFGTFRFGQEDSAASLLQVRARPRRPSAATPMGRVHRPDRPGRQLALHHVGHQRRQRRDEGHLPVAAVRRL